MIFKTVLFKKTCESEFKKGILVTKNDNYLILTENLEVVEDIWDFRETRDFMFSINLKDIYQFEGV